LTSPICACRSAVYRTSGREPRPLVPWLHGGGFVGGSLADLDHPCSRIARRAGVTLVSLVR